MWSHAYIESNNVFVLYIISLCFAMHHMDSIGVIALCMTSRESMSSFSMYWIKVVLAWCHVSIRNTEFECPWYIKSIPGVGKQHRFRESHILFQAFCFFNSSCPTLSFLFPSP